MVGSLVKITMLSKRKFKCENYGKSTSNAIMLIEKFGKIKNHTRINDTY